MFQVRFGKPVSERNMQNVCFIAKKNKDKGDFQFFQSDSRVKWKNSPEELTDQFENDDSIPGYTPPIEVVLPNELGDTLTAAPVGQSNGEASTSHENGMAEAPVDQRNGERHPQQAPSELNGFPQIEVCPILYLLLIKCFVGSSPSKRSRSQRDKRSSPERETEIT